MCVEAGKGMLSEVKKSTILRLMVQLAEAGLDELPAPVETNGEEQTASESFSAMLQNAAWAEARRVRGFIGAPLREVCRASPSA